MSLFGCSYQFHDGRGILLAVAGLQSAGHLSMLAGGLDNVFNGNYYIIDMVIGGLSSIVDNVPLVAGAMGMYTFPIDDPFWIFLTYCAGTGGSLLIIGSAAGVAVMGMEKIDFIWYLKHITRRTSPAEILRWSPSLPIPSSWVICLPKTRPLSV